MDSSNSEPTPAAQARQLLEQDKAQRVNACLLEFKALLDKHRCQLAPMLILTPNGSEWKMQFVALD